MQIKVGLISPNPDQPRKLFDAVKLQELAASIVENGLMQPIKVRPRGKRFEIVIGERRWRAHKLIGADTIEAIVEVVDDRQRDIEAIVENLQRADVTPMEEARAYQRLIDQGMTVDELATKIGVQQKWRITDRLRLLNLAPEFIHLFETGNLSSEAVYEVSRLESHADQHRIITMINRGQLKGYNAIRAAVMALTEGTMQQDIFADRPKATPAELKTVGTMEARVEQVARMVQAGFQENEVVIARKVAPDRARLMADKLGLIRKHCLIMENDLRRAAAQGELMAEVG
jgi:ParB family chromosome partitioning protein